MTPTRLIKRSIIRLSTENKGENVKEFLQGLITNDITQELPIYAALLTAQGKTLFDFIVWEEANDILIDCEADYAEDLVKRLSMYRLRRPIEIIVDETLFVHWSKERYSHSIEDPRNVGLGYRWLSPKFENKESADQSWLAHRLSLGVPEGKAELENVLWLETNAIELNGVSFEKGCYIGQENTARMNWRNKVNRRLVVVPIENSDIRRQKIAYVDLGLAIEHQHVSDINVKLLPVWLKSSLTVPKE